MIPATLDVSSLYDTHRLSLVRLAVLFVDDVGSAEEHLEELAEVESIGGMPVVAAALHSQLPAAAVAFKDRTPEARLAYVMTDGAGLPLALSDLAYALRQRGLIDATVTCGHALGGDYEAVSIFSALAVARHVAGADAAVVAMGPGIVGTNTQYRAVQESMGAIPDRSLERLGTTDLAIITSRQMLLQAVKTVAEGVEKGPPPPHPDHDPGQRRVGIGAAMHLGDHVDEAADLLTRLVHHRAADEADQRDDVLPDLTGGHQALRIVAEEVRCGDVAIAGTGAGQSAVEEMPVGHGDLLVRRPGRVV